MSAHSSGGAYSYSAVDKVGVRPVVYSATGTHASMYLANSCHLNRLTDRFTTDYATSGTQDIYSILGHLVEDKTDDGYYWDVTQNYRGYWFDNSTKAFTSAGGASTGGTDEETEGVSWISWLGHWGDEQYPTSDSRQDCVLDVSTMCCLYVAMYAF